MTNPATFEQDCRTAVDGLRAAFVELYDSVDADPLNPQDVARRFGLNKTFTWNVSRLIAAPDGLSAMSHVPGKAAIEKMLKATAGDGASEIAVARVRDASDAFEQIDGLDTPTTDGLERSRKLAFRGNSGLYGVQARTRLSTSFLAPNAEDPDRLDMAMISGYTGFRRLRSSARWPIFNPRSWTTGEEEPAAPTPRWEPIEPENKGPEGLALMTQFNRGSLPDMEVVESSVGIDVMLKPGPIGNPGAFDCYRGDYMRSAFSRYGTVPNDVGELGATITTPAEFLLVDLMVHESLTFAMQPEVAVFGRLYPDGSGPTDADLYFRLPIRQRVSELPSRPPAVATSLVPRYAEMVRNVYDRLGWDGREFRAMRLQMTYPPFGSTVLLRFPLPESP